MKAGACSHFLTSIGDYNVLFVDWQFGCVSHPFHDLGWYSMLLPKEKVPNRRDFVNLYCDELSKLGINIDKETGWLWYRISMLITGVPIFSLGFSMGFNVMKDFGMEETRLQTTIEQLELSALLDSIVN